MSLRAIERLLEKFPGTGPRYTSYPAANRFHDGIEGHQHVASLEAQDPDRPIGLYVHVPFCEHRCSYCGCHVVPTRRSGVAEAYLAHLESEMELLAGHLGSERPLQFVHLGGGTPTYLTPEQLEGLLSSVGSRFSLRNAEEIAVELDPRVTGAEHVERLASIGVNRVSLGVQDSSDEVQSAIGRGQTREQTDDCFRRCRSVGISSINVDLVYGLPRQTARRFVETLDSVIDLGPERLAVFGYAHMPSLRSNQRQIDESTLPSTSERLELLLLAHSRIQEAGYVHVGLDHFARPTDSLSRAQERRELGRGFMGYTPFRDVGLIGVGVSSVSELAGHYFQNEKKLSKYYERVSRGELPIERGWITSDADRTRRFVIHELLCNLRVDYDEFQRRRGVDFGSYFRSELDRLSAFRDEGLVEMRPGELEVTSDGRLFLRPIAMVFDEHLARDGGNTPAYSRVV